MKIKKKYIRAFEELEKGFSSGAVCLVLTSHPYDESDYIRDYDQFLEFKKGE